MLIKLCRLKISESTSTNGPKLVPSKSCWSRISKTFYCARVTVCKELLVREKGLVSQNVLRWHNYRSAGFITVMHACMHLSVFPGEDARGEISAGGPMGPLAAVGEEKVGNSPSSTSSDSVLGSETLQGEIENVSRNVGLISRLVN